MPRQPFARKYPKAGFSLGPGFLEQRPRAATLIAQCIGVWAEIELQLARLLATALHAQANAGAAVFLALRTGRAQFDALNAAVQASLPERECELFAAIMMVRGSLESQRNDLAHGLFGVSDQVLDGVVWIDPRDRIKNMIEFNDPSRFRRGTVGDLRKFVFVYEESDLESLQGELTEFHKRVHQFVGLAADPSNDALYRLLCNRPQIPEALSQLRAGPKSRR